MKDNDFNQINLLNFNKEYKRIRKPIRLIEFFAGIGSQAKALEILKLPFEHWKICEWAVPSIKAYNAIHLKDFTDYSKGKTKEELIQHLEGNISTNYNEPCNVSKQSEKWLRDVYNNCIATHNLMNIMKVRGKDLEIVDTEKYEYILTYSFPCQDLSLAGKRQGMSVSQSEGGTRSGLLWEVERILDELKDQELPQTLIMENVPEVIGTGNIKDFEKWENKLTELGYTNYIGVLNGKNYLIPQNRRRCFMISFLGDYAYDFPIKQTLKYRLKDFLEKNVDEKYYISKKMVEYIAADNEKWTGNNNGSIVNRDIGCTINTKPDGRRCDASNYIADDLPDNADLKKLKEVMANELIENGKVKENDVIRHSYTTSRISGEMKEIQGNNMSPTLDTRCDCLGVVVKGYSEDSLKRIKENVLEDDEEVAPTITANAMQSINHQNCSLVKVGNYGNGHHAKDVFDPNGLSPTITTGNHGLGQTIAIKNATSKGYLEGEEGDGVDISGRMQYHRGTVQKGISQTITTMGGQDVGVIVENERK